MKEDVGPRKVPYLGAFQKSNLRSGPVTSTSSPRCQLLSSHMLEMVYSLMMMRSTREEGADASVGTWERSALIGRVIRSNGPLTHLDAYATQYVLSSAPIFVLAIRSETKLA